HEPQVMDLAFSPDSRYLADVTAGQKIRLWDLAEEGGEGAILTARQGKGHAQRVSSLAFSPHGDLLASGDLAGAIYLWGVGGQTTRGRPLPPREGPVVSLAFSPDGKTIASMSFFNFAGGDLTLFRVDGEEILRRRESAQAMMATFSPDGESVAY